MDHQLPEILALFGLFLSSAVFYVYAHGINRKNLNMEGFTLSNRALSDKQFSNTFAASSMSLATVLVFFLSAHESYGLFLLVCPITFILSQYFFFYVVKRCNVDFGKCQTISDLVYSVFPSKRVARLITLITITSVIGLAFIELYVGSVILTFFLPKSALWQTLSFFSLGVIVLLYIRLGGYKAIVKTDKWQLSLMMLSITAILIFSLTLPYSTTTTAVNSFTFFSESPLGILIFVLFILFLNISVPFTQPACWQRVVACSSIDEAWSGMKKTTWKTMFIWAVPIMSFILMRVKGYNINDLEGFLTFTKNYSYLTSITLFPIVVVGFASAIFSSADVAIIAIVHSLSDQNTFLRVFEKLSYRDFKKQLTVFTIGILLVLSMLYWVKYFELTSYFVPLMFVSLSQVAIFFFLSAYAIYQIKQGRHSMHFNKNVLFYGLMLGWCCVLFGMWASVNYGSSIWEQATMVLGMMLILLATISSARLSSKNIFNINQNKTKTLQAET